MAVILQVDYTQVFTIIGLIAAFIAGSLTNVIEDLFTRWRMRGVVYKEISAMYHGLKSAAHDLEAVEEETSEGPSPADHLRARVSDYVRESVRTEEETIEGPASGGDLRLIYSLLQRRLNADTYKYLKTRPELSFRIKDIRGIRWVYYSFDMFPVLCDEAGFNVSLIGKEAVVNQKEALKNACEMTIELVEEAFNMLDKELLLKSSSGSGKEYLREYYQRAVVEDREN
jgi:hypothetical protein